MPLRHLSVDTFVIDSGVEAEIEVLIDNGASEVADISVTDTRIIFALGIRVTGFGKAERPSVLIEKIFLLKTEPGVRIVLDRGP